MGFNCSDSETFRTCMKVKKKSRIDKITNMVNKKFPSYISTNQSSEIETKNNEYDDSVLLLYHVGESRNLYKEVISCEIYNILSYFIFKKVVQFTNIELIDEIYDAYLIEGIIERDLFIRGFVYLDLYAEYKDKFKVNEIKQYYIETERQRLGLENNETNQQLEEYIQISVWSETYILIWRSISFS